MPRVTGEKESPLRTAVEASKRKTNRQPHFEEQDLNPHSIESIRDSAARYAAIFENAAVGIARVGTDGSFLEVNQRLCDIVGYSREELMTKTFRDITHKDDLAEDLQTMQRLLAGDMETYRRDKRYCKRDGSIVW